MSLEGDKQKSKDWAVSLTHSLSAFQASAFVQILHPLDVIKTRLQSHDGILNNKNVVPKYSGVIDAAKKIFQSEGIRGLYRGAIYTLFAQSISSSLFFGIYGLRKHQLQREKSRFVIFSASAQAGIIATILTQPIWVVKTRVVLNTEHMAGSRSAFKLIREIYIQHGLRGFYRGLPLSLLLSSHGVVQIQIYEEIDRLFKSYSRDIVSSSIRSLINGFLSKVLATAILFPLTTIRTRVQQNQFVGETVFDKNHSKYLSIQDATLKILKIEGPRGFYKGLTPALLRNAPSNALFFLFYDLFKEHVYKF